MINKIVLLFTCIAYCFQEAGSPEDELLYMKIRFTPPESNVELEHEIRFKLFRDIVPKTCENFETIFKGETMKKNRIMAYKGTIFHRIIKGFMMQGGDFVNANGTGGFYALDSKIDKFDDENFQLKHSSAGILSMANAGRNTNGSQFFITFAPTPHLDNRHVVFGKVIEADLKKLLEISQVKTNRRDQPINDVTIVECGYKNKTFEKDEVI